MFRPIMDLSEGRSCVGLDETVSNEWYGYDIDDWGCTYKEVLHDLSRGIMDLSLSFGEEKTLKVGDCPPEEFIWIECKLKSWGQSKLKKMLGFLKHLVSMMPERENNSPYESCYFGIAVTQTW